MSNSPLTGCTPIRGLGTVWSKRLLDDSYQDKIGTAELCLKARATIGWYGHNLSQLLQTEVKCANHSTSGHQTTNKYKICKDHLQKELTSMHTSALK